MKLLYVVDTWPHATETPAGAGEGARDAGELVSLQGSETKSES